MSTAARSLAFHANLNGHLDVSLTLAAETGRRTREHLDRWRTHRSAITTAEDLVAEQRRIREATVAAIGGLPVYQPTPPPEYGAALSEAGFEVIPLLFYSAPDVAVPATLYRPVGPRLAVGRGAVLITCGHTDLAKADPEYQALARRLAATGLVVLIFDPIGQGERHSYLPEGGSPDPVIAPGTTEHTYAGVQAWWQGESPARYFVRDALAGLELLRSLPDVDPNRVGVTGNSGGGYLCCLLMAIDGDLAAAAPGTFVCGRDAYLDAGQRQDAEQILLGGTAAGIDHGDLLITMSPAPVLVLAAEYDFFPYPGTLDVLDEYNDLLQRCDRAPIGLMTTANGHSYDDVLAMAATRFFAEHLGGTPAQIDPGPPYPPTELQVTSSGQICRDRPQQKIIFDESPDGRLPDRDLDWLERTVHRPRRPIGIPGRRWFPSTVVDPASGRYARQGFWQTERGSYVAGVVVPATAESASTTRIVLRDGGTSSLTDIDAQACDPGRHTLFLDVRGTGAVVPHDREGKAPHDLAGASYKLLSDLLWIDDSLQAGRTWDLLQTVDLMLDGLIPDVDPTGPIEIVADGCHALTAVSAGLLNERLQIALTGPLDTDALINRRLWDASDGRWQSVLPGWTRHFDDGAAVELLGPRLRIDRSLTQAPVPPARRAGS